MSHTTTQQPTNNVAIEQLPKLGELGESTTARQARRTKWRVVKTFTPMWFSANMGTGIVSILLRTLPYQGHWIYWISVIFFAFNLLLFLAFSTISVLRYLLYPGLWSTMLHHPTMPLFLGTFPIGLATVIEMIVLVCGPAWGQWAITVAWALWWIDAVLAIIVCYGILFYMIRTHDIQLNTVTATWLLPIASVIVASATGALVAQSLDNKQHALWTVLVCYFLWGTAVPLSMSVLVLYFYRLMVHNLPPRQLIVSSFLPVAALGEGAFAIMQISKVTSSLVSQDQSLQSVLNSPGQILFVLGWFIGIVMWSYGCAWLVFAIAGVSSGKLPFNLGWWGFVFPVGVWASAAVSFGDEIPSSFFSMLGTVLSVATVLLWIIVAVGTVRGCFNGTVWVAPDFELWEKSQSPENSDIN